MGLNERKTIARPFRDQTDFINNLREDTTFVTWRQTSLQYAYVHFRMLTLVRFADICTDVSIVSISNFTSVPTTIKHFYSNSKFRLKYEKFKKVTIL